MVIGTVSDYSGKGGENHRKVARQALEVADRVVFVSPQASHVEKLRCGEIKDRLTAFATSYQAAQFLGSTSVAGELIYVMASITDHLERLMLAEFGEVTCWRERCGRIAACPNCSLYREAHPPPFGLTPDGSAAAAESAAAAARTQHRARHVWRHRAIKRHSRKIRVPLISIARATRRTLSETESVTSNETSRKLHGVPTRIAGTADNGSGAIQPKALMGITARASSATSP